MDETKRVIEIAKKEPKFTLAVHHAVLLAYDAAHRQRAMGAKRCFNSYLDMVKPFTPNKNDYYKFIFFYKNRLKALSQ